MADPFSIAAFSAGMTALSNAFIVPYFKKKVEDTLEESESPAFNLQHYLEFTLRRCNVVNSIALLDKASLEEVYEPMSIEVYARDRRINYKVDDFPHDMLQAFPNLLIEDRAGQGKSTLMKFIVTRAIYVGTTLPIFIELRRIEKGQSIINHIGDLFKDADGQPIRPDIVISIIKENSCLIIFDGYDEINEQLRPQITSEIQNIIIGFKNCRFILTSRVEDALQAFTNLYRSSITKLSRQSAYSLLRRYDQGREIAERLIGQLEKNSNYQVWEYLTNPLLVSLLYRAFEYREDIPIEKHMYYQQVYESLFDRHDLAKGESFKREKRCGLDQHSFDKLLRILCMLTFLKEEYEYTQDQLLKSLDQVKPHLVGIEFSSNDVLHDLTHSIPLIFQEGQKLKWIHRSIQEYFTAKYICYETGSKFPDYMSRIYSKSERGFSYFNVLDLVYSMEYKKFRHTIGKLVLEDIFSHHKAESEMTQESEIAKYTFGKTILVYKNDSRHSDALHDILPSFPGAYDLFSGSRRVKIDKSFYNYLVISNFKHLILSIMLYRNEPPFKINHSSEVRRFTQIPRELAIAASDAIKQPSWITLQALLTNYQISENTRKTLLSILKSNYYDYTFSLDDLKSEIEKINSEIAKDQVGLLDIIS